MVADFSLKRKWRDDLLDKWQEAFQMLVAVDDGLQHQVSKYPPNTRMGNELLVFVVVVCTLYTDLSLLC